MNMFTCVHIWSRLNKVLVLCRHVYTACSSCILYLFCPDITAHIRKMLQQVEPQQTTLQFSFSLDAAKTCALCLLGFELANYLEQPRTLHIKKNKIYLSNIDKKLKLTWVERQWRKLPLLSVRDPFAHHTQDVAGVCACTESCFHSASRTRHRK